MADGSLSPAPTRGRAVWISVPAYTGQTILPTAKALAIELLTLALRGHNPHMDDECGNGEISVARDLIVARFMAATSHDDDALAMVDSDVQWEPGALADLVEKPTDFRCGIYPHRCDPLNFSVRHDMTQPYLMSSRTHGMLKIWGAPAGFMVMSRRMLRLMTERYADMNYYSAAAPNNTVCGLFQAHWTRNTIMPNGKIGTIKLSEDYSFCQRWVDMGGEAWVEPKIKMGHTGLKTFSGSLHDFLTEKAEREAAQPDLPKPVRAFA